MRRFVTTVAALVGMALCLLTAGCDGLPHQLATKFGNTVDEEPGESRSEAFARLNQTYGPAQIVRVYNPGLPEPWSTLTSDLGTASVVISFKADPSTVLSGALDGQLRSWFAAAPRDRTIYWSYFHEPEDDIEAGYFTADAYRAAWLHIADLAAEADNPHLEATIILMCYTVGPLSGRTWTDYVPESDLLDVLAWDCYNHKADVDYYVDPETLLSKAIMVSDSRDVQWGIAELGSRLVTGDAGRGRAQWLHDVALYAADHQAAFVTYFDVDRGPDKDFRLTDRPSIEEWRKLVGG